MCLKSLNLSFIAIVEFTAFLPKMFIPWPHIMAKLRVYLRRLKHRSRRDIGNCFLAMISGVLWIEHWEMVFEFIILSFCVHYILTVYIEAKNGAKAHTTSTRHQRSSMMVI